MRRLILIAALLSPLLAAGYAIPAKAADIGISLRIGDRYRGDHLDFQYRPQMVLVPGTRVYYVDDPDYLDCDVYRFEGWYYAFDAGRWYRASTYRGPWIYIRGRAVPRVIYAVPADYRRNWYGDYRYWRYRDYDRYWNRRHHWRDRHGWRDRDQGDHDRGD